MKKQKNNVLIHSNISELERARKILGLTLHDVSKHIGITYAAIHNYEIYKRYARPEHAWSLIEFYEKHNIHLSLEDFYPHEHFVGKFNLAKDTAVIDT